MTLEDVKCAAPASGNESTKKKTNEAIRTGCGDLRKTLVRVLKKADAEKRLTCGMMPTLQVLETDPANALFCIIPQTRKYDSAFHIQHVLLEAFCYQQDIHIVKVDNADKLRELICCLRPCKPKAPTDVSCVLVSKKPTDDEEKQAPLSEEEKLLRAFCIDAQNVPSPPVIRLPTV